MINILSGAVRITMDLYNKGVHPAIGGSGKAFKLMRADLWIVVSGRVK